ncbi:hypothetical protein NGM10_07390 [Halorussus salilacus]|uniref:hypothetical protein n=1 Tax=Halorussus salilacus TaxID=2953750 RepID=UPI0020A1B7FB|nr:hypothetical protein [Halorussus salilacus]USZ69546.1 hypothetical protein NGM10_07390 [Halorussus salilacus]
MASDDRDTDEERRQGDSGNESQRESGDESEGESAPGPGAVADDRTYRNGGREDADARGRSWRESETNHPAGSAGGGERPPTGRRYGSGVGRRASGPGVDTAPDRRMPERPTDRTEGRAHRRRGRTNPRRRRTL